MFLFGRGNHLIRGCVLTVLCCWMFSYGVQVASAAEPLPGDALLSDYFRIQCDQIAGKSLSEIQTADDWAAHQSEYRSQLQEMLGLSPWPERTPLKPEITGRVEHADFIVEKLHFQSLPGLYVTGDLFYPKTISKPLPAVLYVCGHYVMRKGNVSLGGKTMFQNHGSWFARNGYVCLVIDTIQLGEIEGIHHGTYDKGMWWWQSRGYVPGGVEVWNGMRAIDYLQSRAEVNPERIGLTGRSGGGAMTCYIAALDERVKAAVPVAGITTLQNHIVDGCIEGHCDCMYPVNTYHWDFPQLAALVAPRPLLIANQDKDRIFPLDGVVEVYSKARRIYDLLGAKNKIGLFIAEGGHKDIQELQFASFHWFNRFLKDENPQISMLAESFLPPENLTAFETLPADERVTSVQEWFVPEARLLDQTRTREELLQGLLPARNMLHRAGQTSSIQAQSLNLKLDATLTNAGQQLRLRKFQFNSEEPYRLDFYVLDYAGDKDPSPVQVEVLDEATYQLRMAQLKACFSELKIAPKTTAVENLPAFKGTWIFFAPRGVGETRWSQEEAKLTHLRRRFVLLGTTEDLVRVEDVIRALSAVKEALALDRAQISLVAQGAAVSWALHAAFLSQDVSGLTLTNLATNDRQGPQYPAIRQWASAGDVLAGVAAGCDSVRLHVTDSEELSFWNAVRTQAAQRGISNITVDMNK